VLLVAAFGVSALMVLTPFVPHLGLLYAVNFVTGFFMTFFDLSGKTDLPPRMLPWV